MLEWLESVAGPQYVPAILWTLGALVALVIVLLIARAFRRMSSGTYVAGGRNRKTRLAIMDATAVDSHRRLVLIRRDDVEHLILIGGGNDLLVEANIRVGAQSRRPEPTVVPQQQVSPQAPQQQGQRPRVEPSVSSAPTSRPSAPPPVAAPRPGPTPQPPVQPVPAQRPAAPTPQQRPAPAAQNSRQASAPIVTPVAPPRVALPPPAPAAAPYDPSDEIDQSLLDELEVTLDEASSKAGSERNPAPSLEDEMARLLGELSTPKK